MPTLDVDQFEERAAIAEFDGGMSRFAAETMAAQEQGMARWQALQIVKEANNAQRDGHSAGCWHSAASMAREQRAVYLPGVQRAPEEENRSMPERDAHVGRDRVALPSLRNERGTAA